MCAHRVNPSGLKAILFRNICRANIWNISNPALLAFMFTCLCLSHLFAGSLIGASPPPAVFKPSAVMCMWHPYAKHKYKRRCKASLAGKNSTRNLYSDNYDDEILNSFHETQLTRHPSIDNSPTPTDCCVSDYVSNTCRQAEMPVVMERGEER